VSTLQNIQHTITGKAWEKIGLRHHHGINVPLASIWTMQSSGIGEFLDLLSLIDYCSSIKFDILQILPINDSGLDPSPYNALSSVALHPIYLSLHALPHIPKNLRQELQTFKNFNHSKRVCYLQILQKKLKWLYKYIEAVGTHIAKTPQYQSFVEHNHWLLDYSLFKVLKKKNNGQEYHKWENEEKQLNKIKRDELTRIYNKEIQFYYIVQYLCSTQLKLVKNHAEKKGVFLKGDIPILLSPDSVDVWTHQELFDLTYMAGSPPNTFDPEGQVWNFPLYNWNLMEKHHLKWWQQRIQLAAQYFHLYRIDHILGFFRIWAIPRGEKKAKMGHFIPNQPALMETQGRKLLKLLISFSDMLPIGEDLGAPLFVHKCMQEYGIPSTKIFRRYRRWKTDRSFIPYEEYDPISISSVSTHDLETVYIWWEKFPDEAAAYAKFKKWKFSPTLTWQQQFEILWDNHNSNSLFHVNLLQEYLALLPKLTWKNPYDERINIPGSNLKNNWRYTYKEPLDVLTKNEELKLLFEKLLQNT